MTATYLVTITHSVEVCDCESKEEAINIAEQELRNGDFEIDIEKVEENEDDS